MKKRTFVAGAIAMAMGAMMGATTAPDSAQSEQSRQVSNEQPTGNSQQQRPFSARRTEVAVREFAEMGKMIPVYRPVFNRSYRKWCASSSSGFNRITHSRNTKRKHRRAA